ncbi:MAG: 30S ribosomal protein S12 methylthiotransferase RimO [Propionibacteriaceae bacterium]|jgi:ribosomal protein S12 methylthiotransferase RimO|nr:30S ribosomal protein S12 methylthiotransferase RimO [Propionibacteriaceae bacterium]
MGKTVHITSLGCARNETDSEELAARLALDGFEMVEDPGSADVLLVNTCGFIDAAKKDSIDTLLDFDPGEREVVAVGCLAERYGAELAGELPEVSVLGFDDYPAIGARLRDILSGVRPTPHQPRDRRLLLPLTPASRAAHANAFTPGHALPGSAAPASGPRVLRKRLSHSPSAPLKIASGCDRHCTFCAIPAFRGAYLSREISHIVAEARWLAGQGVKEAVLVSENSTSYGKDLGVNLTALLRALDESQALEWIRVSYLQPAEMRPDLIEAIAGSERVLPYFDLPFQHAAAGVLRQMRRFGDAESFLALLAQIRQIDPLAGVRSNFIVGFPGEREQDLELLASFIEAAEFDAVGIFGYSDEEGTQAAGLGAKLSEAEIADRVDWLSGLAHELASTRAADRLGERVRILVEERTEEGLFGRAAHQGPESDGVTAVVGQPSDLRVGDLVYARVTGSDGIDLAAVQELQ